MQSQGVARGVSVSDLAVARSPSPLFAPLAWLAMLLASNIPTIAYQQVSGAIVPVWLLAAQEGALIALLALATLARPLRPIRGYLITLFVVSAAFVAYSPLSHTVWWQDLDRSATWWEDALIRQGLAVIASAALALTLIGSHLTRRDLALAGSDPQALARRDLLILNLFNRPWRRAFIWYGGLMTGLILFFFLRHTALPADAWRRWALSLPAILPLAALNTLNEEFQYRQTPLARLRGVVGPRQALWLTAILFGISHFYGNPSGYAGVLAATWFGYLQAKSIQESRGSTWAWLMHFLQDAVIFSFIALA